jgi:O-acetyl-ADP-ribose deacetylase (regulator of RNase III)
VGAITIHRGDITTDEQADAIVNAANAALQGGGGVDGAIHRAAGPSVLDECRGLGGCQTGDAKVTRSGRLKSKIIVHAVGPVWRGGGHDEEAALASCYQRSIELAAAHGCARVALPAISTGVYEYPLRAAAAVTIASLQIALKQYQQVAEARLWLFDEESFEVFSAALQSAGESHRG